MLDFVGHPRSSIDCVRWKVKVTLDVYEKEETKKVSSQNNILKELQVASPRYNSKHLKNQIAVTCFL